jgi:hypothetical protein
LTEVADPPQTQASDYSHDIVLDSGDGFSDEPFIRLQADELPPAGVQAIENTWALVSRSGEPVAFISPDHVAGLDPYQPVAAIFGELDDAYVADFGHPRDFFRASLGAPRQVRGRVVVFDRPATQTRYYRARLSEFAEAVCALGLALEVGELCDDNLCACERRDRWRDR